LIAARVNARPRWSTPLPATPRPWRCARCMRVLRWRDRRNGAAALGAVEHHLAAPINSTLRVRLLLTATQRVSICVLSTTTRTLEQTR
jgi:hypothetical protein